MRTVCRGTDTYRWEVSPPPHRCELNGGAAQRAGSIRHWRYGVGSAKIGPLHHKHASLCQICGVSGGVEDRGNRGDLRKRSHPSQRQERSATRFPFRDRAGTVCYRWLKPPSTARVWPVMKSVAFRK